MERQAYNNGSEFAIDRNGVPTSDACYKIISFLLANNRQAFNPKEIAKALSIPPGAVDLICRELTLVELVVSTVGDDIRYQYATDTPNSTLQDLVERALIDYPLIAATMNLPARPAPAVRIPHRR
jgi:hypothetical protein